MSNADSQSQEPDRILRAKKDLANVDREIAYYEDVLRRKRNERIRISSYIEMDQRYSQPASPAPAVSTTEPPKKSLPEGVAKGTFFSNFAVRYIAAHGVQTIASLASVIENAGYEIGGQNPKASLASYLSRDERLFYDKDKGGWILAPKDKGPAEAGPSKNEGAGDGSRTTASDHSPEGSIPSASTLFTGPLLSGNSVDVQTSTLKPAAGDKE